MPGNYLKAIIAAAICLLWLAVVLIIMEVSLGWIANIVIPGYDIKPLLIIISVSSYLFHILPTFITKSNRCFINNDKLVDITHEKEKES